MRRVSRRSRFILLGVSLLAILSSIGPAAGTAGAASWHIEGKPFSGSEWASVLPNSKMTIELPTLGGAEITCETRQAEPAKPGSIALMTESTHAWYHFVFINCVAEGGGEKFPECEHINAPEFSFSGLGAGTATELFSEDSQTIEFASGKGCWLPLKNKFSMPKITQSYGEEHFALRVNVSGTGGKYGAQPANLSGTLFWTLWENRLFGYY